MATPIRFPDTLRSLFERWSTMAAQHRVLAVGIFLAGIAALAFAVCAQRDTSVPLFAVPLDAEQTAEVTAQLAAWNVPFVASADNVRVAGSRRNDLLLQLSLAGLPRRRLAGTRDALADVGPLTPQSVLDARRVEGLADDVALGLRGIADIGDARVLIAPAQPALFADDTAREATASVRLTLRPGTTLSTRQIDGIRGFVAASVPGLDAGHVAILDDRGIALGSAQTSADDDADALQNSLQSALDSAFGSGSTIVRVRAIRDAQSREVHEVRRAPLGERSIGETRTDERFTGDRKHYSKVQIGEDRGSDVRDERTHFPQGRLVRLSVAIVVDRARGINREQLRDLASAAAGLSPEQGDTINVQEMAFADPARKASPWGSLLGLAALLLPSVVAVGGGLLAVRWSVKPAARAIALMRRHACVAPLAASASGPVPAQVRGTLRGEPPHTAAAIISALPAATATAVLEMYPPEERAAIVRRMRRAVAPIVPEYQTLVRRG